MGRSLHVSEALHNMEKFPQKHQFYKKFIEIEIWFENSPRAWASADFFSRGGQNFSRRGARTYFLPKNNEKDNIFPKKSKKLLFLDGLGRPGGQEPPLPSPTDAHVREQDFVPDHKQDPSYPGTSSRCWVDLMRHRGLRRQHLTEQCLSKYENLACWRRKRNYFENHLSRGFNIAFGVLK